MSKKLWGGRFSKETDPLVEEFTKSIDYDYKLALFDVVGSIIHVSVLEKSKLITSEEAAKLTIALGKIYAQIRNNEFEPDRNSEDIHTNIQNLLEKDEEIGDLALKLHTARSRNEQVLFSLKLFCKWRLLEIAKLCAQLNISLHKSCEKVKGIVIPGYTHLQHAQLIYLSDYLGSYVEMAGRDEDRVYAAAKNIKVNLGAGAFAGTPVKAEFYNEAIKKYLQENKDFADDTDMIQDVNVAKSLDTVSDRDFVIEALSVLSILGMHLSRLAEDLIIWSTKEFGFVELDDAFTTGSSLMPHKKNPDVLELIRGYTGTLYGNLVSVLTMMKGLPLTYNRDMQLDKPPLFSSFEILEKELKVLPKLIETLIWNEEAIKNKIDNDWTLYATDWAYYLVKEKKVPFKEAHDIIGSLVKKAIAKGGIIKVSKTEMKEISDKLEKDELLELMNPVRSVKSRISIDRSKK